MTHSTTPKSIRDRVNSSLMKVENITTGIFWRISVPLISLRHSIPSLRGIFRSRKIRFGSCATDKARALSKASPSFTTVRVALTGNSESASRNRKQSSKSSSARISLCESSSIRICNIQKVNKNYGGGDDDQIPVKFYSEGSLN